MKTCKESGCLVERAPGRSRCWQHYGLYRRKSEIQVKYPEGYRLLFVDIETRPTEAYTWSLFKANIGVNQIIRPGGMICFAATWHGSGNPMEFYSDWNDGHKGMVRRAWELLDQADAVCHYYGSQFDVKHLNAEFLLQGFPPPSPFKQIDLKLAVSKQFRFPSNKLQFIAEVLGLEGKEEHEGFGLWAKCLNKNHPDHHNALARMESYNKRDVELLEECYEILLPWLPNVPNRRLYENGAGCPTCGASYGSVVQEGFYYTKLSKFKKYHCTTCHSWFRSSKRESGINIQEAVL